jgi:hypothetical protein
MVAVRITCDGSVGFYSFADYDPIIFLATCHHRHIGQCGISSQRSTVLTANNTTAISAVSFNRLFERLISDHSNRASVRWGEASRVKCWLSSATAIDAPAIKFESNTAARSMYFGHRISMGTHHKPAQKFGLGMRAISVRRCGTVTSHVALPVRQ